MVAEHVLSAVILTCFLSVFFCYFQEKKVIMLFFKQDAQAI